MRITKSGRDSLGHGVLLLLALVTPRASDILAMLSPNQQARFPTSCSPPSLYGCVLSNQVTIMASIVRVSSPETWSLQPCDPKSDVALYHIQTSTPPSTSPSPSSPGSMAPPRYFARWKPDSHAADIRTIDHHRHLKFAPGFCCSLVPGRVLNGRYKLLCCIGIGSYGHVWVASNMDMS